MTEEAARYGSPRITVRRDGVTGERLKRGRPRKEAYEAFKEAIEHWILDGEGVGGISVGPFKRLTELNRFRMGFPRSLAYQELDKKVRTELRSRLSEDRTTIHYYLKGGRA